MQSRFPPLFRLGLALILLLAACGDPQAAPIQLVDLTPEGSAAVLPAATVQPTRPAYDPGQLVDYIAQTGDTLPALAAHFNTTEEEIRRANPILPESVTTLPPGLPMQIPIYYRAYWGSQYQIIPDSLFVNGPATLDFDVEEFVNEQPGWLKSYRGAAARDTLTGAQIVELVATNFSISPRLLLALLEYRAGALSQSILAPDLRVYPMGYEDQYHRGLYLQLVWVANTLNDAYYRWRGGSLIQFDRPSGAIYRPDPWQNAASVALQVFFNTNLPSEEFDSAIGPQGFAATYAGLFGDPWEDVQPHIPGSLLQPDLRLPFSPGETWAFTGGPHTGWGTGAPYAALDFAPGLESRGCVKTQAWATAPADGLVVRTGEGTLVLDLDGDGDERTGWVLFFLHLEEDGRLPVGRHVLAGQPLGHPSCEGGEATGTHVHIARKYNGEWILADGALPFVMEGWQAHAGAEVYQGTLTRPGFTVVACTCSDQNAAITSYAEPVPFPTPALATPTP